MGHIAKLIARRKRVGASTCPPSPKKQGLGRIATCEEKNIPTLVEIVAHSSPDFINHYIKYGLLDDLLGFHEYAKSIAPKQDGEFEQFYEKLTTSQYWHSFASICTKEENELTIIRQAPDDSIGFMNFRLGAFLERMNGDFAAENLAEWEPRMKVDRQ